MFLKLIDKDVRVRGQEVCPNLYVLSPKIKTKFPCRNTSANIFSSK